MLVQAQVLILILSFLTSILQKMRYPPPGSANLDGKNGIVQQLNIVASFRDLLSLAAGDSMAENLNGLAADAERACR